MDRPDDNAASFDRARDALRGRFVELDASASKLLHLMLANGTGCDAIITSDKCEIHFARHPSRHHYFLSPTPAVLTSLIRFAGAVTPVTSIRARIGPASVPAHSPAGAKIPASFMFPAWSFPAHRLWLDWNHQEIRVSLRDDEHQDGPVPSALPQPIRPSTPSMIQHAAPVACPHCGQAALEHRDAHDGWLVCSTCARSFQS